MKKLLLASFLTLSAQGGLILCHSGNPACPDAASWSAQVQGQQIVETFTWGLLPSTRVTQSGGLHGFSLVERWFDSLVNHPYPSWPNQPLQTTTFFLEGSPLLWGFGAEFNTAPGHGGHASGVAIEINGQIITNLRHQNDNFFGVIATDAASMFSSVTLGTPPACWDGTLSCTGWEIYNLDNFRFAYDDAPSQHTEVPEPSAWAMLALGLGVVVAGRRGR